MLPIVTPEEMNAIDRAAPEPVDVLIGRAAAAVARAAVELLGGTYGRTVNLIAGPGNNGADGRVASQRLAARGVRVREFDATELDAGDATVLPPADLVIDAGFGTGFRGDWWAPEVGDALVLAVDIPTGLDATTGLVGGRALAAERTVTFQALKPGLLLDVGPDLVGEVVVADIGLDASASRCHLAQRADAVAWWPARPRDAHKWRSAVRAIAGSPGMAGAGELCATAALRAGSGLVTLSSPGCESGDGRLELLRPALPRAGWAQIALDDIERFGAVVVGPGLGREDLTMGEVRELVERCPVPVVVDGDGLAALVGAKLDPERPTVLTPHEGEFERLTGSPPGDDRIGAVRAAAAASGCTVLLKGPTTVVAAPDGSALVVDHGDQRLATAGSGDVLSGMIGAAMAGGASPLRAAAAAAWLHADAARRGPEVGLVAGDIIDHLPAALTPAHAAARSGAA